MEQRVDRSHQVISWLCDPALTKSEVLDRRQPPELMKAAWDTLCPDPRPSFILKPHAAPHICRKYRPWPQEFHGARYWPWCTAEGRMDEELRGRHGPHILPLTDFADINNGAPLEPLTIRGKPNRARPGGFPFALPSPTLVLSSGPLPHAPRMNLFVVEPRPTLTLHPSAPQPCRPMRRGDVGRDAACREKSGYANFVNAAYIM